MLEYCEHVYKDMGQDSCPKCGRDTHETDWAKQAQLISSYEYLEQAEQAIEAIQADDTPATVRKQVEKMNIALFKAKCKNRKELDLNYREDKQETNNNIITPQLTLKVVNNSDNQLKITNNDENN